MTFKYGLYPLANRMNVTVFLIAVIFLCSLIKHWIKSQFPTKLNIPHLRVSAPTTTMIPMVLSNKYQELSIILIIVFDWMRRLNRLSLRSAVLMEWLALALGMLLWLACKGFYFTTMQSKTTPNGENPSKWLNVFSHIVILCKITKQGDPFKP